jgi:4-amino-4-deoxy-L-arabinose transferase-like glycosyltransferase
MINKARMRAPAGHREARSHAPFLLLLVLAVPAVMNFTASDVIASVGDDSISYLMLARFILDPRDALIREWVAYQIHFPPLFPLVLAMTGGASNLAIAHAVVAVFAILSLVLVYRYTALVLGGNAGGLLVAVLFLLTPTAWISIRAILSEPLFLFFTLWALYYYETRLASADGPPHQWLLFGVLLGAAFLVRTAGATLLLAYGVHVAVAAVTRTHPPRLPRRLLPFLPLALMVAMWLLWRPKAEGYNYQGVISTVVTELLPADPIRFLLGCAQFLFGGWIRSFTADSEVHWLAKAVFAFVGLLGIAGAVLRARANRLDGWYVLLTLPVVFLWVFSEDSTRRLLYPLVPLVILHAAVFVAFVLGRIPSQRQRRLLAATVVALPVLLALPAWLLVQSKSMDRDRIYASLRYRYSDMTEYYTTIDVKLARGIASRHAAVLGGLESLDSVTPPGARIMWMRPDYIATLGHRQGVPWYYRWSHREFLREIQRSKVDYIVAASLLKADMDGGQAGPVGPFEWALQFSDLAYSVPSVAKEGYEVAVLKVDHAAIGKMLDAGSRAND